MVRWPNFYFNYQFCIFTVMLVTQTLFNGYDIASEMSKTDVLDGTALIIIILLFSGLGIYAHRLAYRLFIHPKFLDMMRLHAKTIFKVCEFQLMFLFKKPIISIPTNHVTIYSIFSSS